LSFEQRSQAGWIGGPKREVILGCALKIGLMRSEPLRASLLLFTAIVVLLLAYQATGDIFLAFGPNDYPYVAGFREDFEIDEPTFIHWSGTQGRARLPFLLPGPFDLRFRYKRHVAVPAEIRVFIGDEMVDLFEAPQGDFTLRTIHVSRNPRPWAPVEIVFLARSRDPRPLGLALDWLQVVPKRPIVPTIVPFVYLLGLIAGLYLFPRLIGFSERAALRLGLAGLCAVAIWVGFDKLAPLHAASAIGMRYHLAALIIALVAYLLRRNENSAFSRPEARWALLAFYIGTLIRLVALFHSEFYYPDVRTHSKFVSLIWTEGLSGFLSDHIAHQHRHLLGLQYVGDRWLAFPYPPLLYLTIYPLSLLRLPVDEWMKLVPAILVGFEGLVVFVIAYRLGASARAAAAATWFHAFAPLVAFRLTVASYAAMFGHFWDLLVALYLICFFPKLDRFWVGMGLAGLVAVSLLSYAGSALVLGLFIPAFSVAILLRREDGNMTDLAIRAAFWALVGALVAIALYYIQYIPELVPGWLGGSETSQTAASSELIQLRVTPLAALGTAAYRVYRFYGPLYGLIIFLGLPFVSRKLSHQLILPLTVGTLATFFGLNFLRSGLGETHIFQFTKDDLVLLPLAVIVYGLLVDTLALRSRWGKAVASALLVGWIAWGCVELARDVRIRFRRLDYPPASAYVTELRIKELQA
jgi:hypothetical protein